jgi:hypothetical protein
MVRQVTYVGAAFRRPVLLAAAMAIIAAAAAVQAQGRAQGPPQPPPTPQAGAPIDLTGYWVAVVNEDWRWRMQTPPKGDGASVPLNPAGTKVLNAWDPATDGSCLAYGAAGLMRMPTRLHITWENPTTLKVETDAGQQTRRFHFDRNKMPTGKSAQGHSIAEWERIAAGRGQPSPGGHLKVVTTSMTAGWLRKNGVPYSDSAILTEYVDRFAAPNGDQWLVFTSLVNDPTYLSQEFVTSSHFKREADGSKWSPAPCK